MSYDFYARVDTGGPEPHDIEPYFGDVHPAFDGDGIAGNVMVTPGGYARCGNYTSNVSGMWSKCLTAALETVPDARQWIGQDDRLCIVRYGPTVTYVGGETRERTIETERLCLRDLDGVRMGDLIPLLTAAVGWGVEHIAELHEDDPSNGWGNAEGAVTYLWDIQRFCEAHPNATLHISS